MVVLVIGGTSYFGIHLVRELVKKGHDVTIATRGLTQDGFGTSVKRVIMDRNDRESVYKALWGHGYDVVCDNFCFSSNEVMYLFDAIQTKRYVLTSSRGVYDGLISAGVTDEQGFDPYSNKLKWCHFDGDVTYYEGKRQAETALFQAYDTIPAAAARFPIVVGADDTAKRLEFYAECIINGRPMYVINWDKEMSCIKSDEAGRFLAWLAEGSLLGPVNAASYGGFRVADVIGYIEKKTGKKAVLDKDGEPGTCNETPALALDTTKAAEAGFKFSRVDTWIYEVLDELIEKVKVVSHVN